MNSCGTLGINVVLTDGKLRALASGCQELVQVIRKKLDIFAGAVLQDKRDAASSADAGDRGWRETEDRPFRQLLEFLVQTCLDGLILFAPALALIPGFQRYPEERVIRSSDVAEQTETDDACGVLNSRRLCENFLHLFCGCACALHGGRIRKLHVDIEVALVFVGQEAGGKMFAKEPRCTRRRLQATPSLRRPCESGHRTGGQSCRWSAQNMR